MNREAQILRLEAVSKTYMSPAGNFDALKDISFTLGGGEFLAIMGKSGSGKSTLVNLMTGIDSPTAGRITSPGGDIQALDENGRARWRRHHAGVVFQFFQLLPTLTIAENVMLPLDFAKRGAAGQRRARALDLLAALGIADQCDKLPADLSGGQQQRAAIARALACDPPLIVADEPTGNLDSRTTEEVMSLFQGLAGQGKAVVMVTHERELSRYFTRRITLADGRIVDDSKGMAA